MFISGEFQDPNSVFVFISRIRTKMKVFTTVCLFVLVSVVAAAPAETYPDKYSAEDVQEILNNRRLLLPYIKCALDQGKCSADAKEMKERLREALETECSKCSPKQKEIGGIVFKHIINNEKDYWNQLVDKYDPEKRYAPIYEEKYLVQ
ncbi:allergen Tha p 1-like [Ostrinia nubilalis]|uniref:allergen Tha p 1-like n=1 Tax=Ostrinia furnacalis TaxID=93504 RepID=UPI00103BF442|nr:allergen Tha p 1-like [Ostrinia furnacalis]